MKQDLLISIIVPNYNNGKYIADCIDSLINQTYRNIEIVIIDDGSTDNSVDIIRQYLTDKRIKLICQKNQGANIARKVGLNNSTGQYCLYVDGDDWLELNSIETLVGIICKKEYDVVKFLGVIEPIKKIKNKYDFGNKNEQELFYPEIYNLLIETKVLHNLCFSLYKKELLLNNKAFYSHISYAEDYYANLELFSKKPTLLITNKELYHYRMNQNSTTKRIDKDTLVKNFNEMIFVYEQLFDYLKKWNIDNDINRSKVSFVIIDATREILLRMTKNSNKKDFNIIAKELLDKKVFKNIRDNVEYKSIQKIIKQKAIAYKIKNILIIKSIYYNKPNSIYIYKYFLYLYELKNKILKG